MDTTNILTITPEPIRPERYLTNRDVAEHYSMSLRWVEGITALGCPSRLIGGRRLYRLYRLSEVDAWLVAAEPHAA
jgi:hypothetical protein